MICSALRNVAASAGFVRTSYGLPTVRPSDRKTAIAAAISRFLENRCFQPFLFGGLVGPLIQAIFGSAHRRLTDRLKFGNDLFNVRLSNDHLLASDLSLFGAMQV